MIGSYNTILTPSEGLYREKGSKFIAYAASVSSVKAAHELIEQRRKEHPKARHHCYAYRIGGDQLQYRSNDDGEPSGTAGKPILGQIDSFGLSDIVVVVSRYFGGKLLGAAGLAIAYKVSAHQALSQAKIITKELMIQYQVSFGYEVMGTLLDALNRHGASIIHQDFSSNPKVDFSLPLLHEPCLLDQIIAQTLDIYLEEVGGRRTIGNLKIEIKS
jgi:uncharacterized YigZ family protein